MDRLLSGRLPRGREHLLFAGLGDGAICACCETAITPSQVQYDVEPRHGASAPFALHLECYNAWTAAAELMAETLTSNHLPDVLTAVPHASAHLFLIAYDYPLLVRRATLLRSQGYQVSSALRNQAAIRALERNGNTFDLFVLGPAAPSSTRLEMVAWLRERYPHTRILALNADEHERLEGLKYNANDHIPAVWLPMAAAAAVDCRS